MNFSKIAAILVALFLLPGPSQAATVPGDAVSFDVKLTRQVRFSELKAALVRPAVPVALLEDYPRLKERPIFITHRPSFIKVYPDSFKDPAFFQGPEKPLRLELAGGEWGSAQLVLLPLQGDLSQVRFSCSTLTQEQGSSRLDGRLMRFCEVGFVPYHFILQGGKAIPQTRWNGSSRYPGPLQPDPLIPRQTFELKQGLIQPIWLTIRIPRSTPAGLYRGHISVSPPAPGELKVPLEIEVSGFDLPETLVFPSGVTLLTHAISSYYLGRDDYENCLPPEFYKKFIKLYTDYKLTPKLKGATLTKETWDKRDHTNNLFFPYLKNVQDKEGNWKFDFTVFDELISYMRDLGAPSLCIGYVPSFPPEQGVSPKFKKLLKDYIPAVSEHLRPQGRLQDAFLHGQDEAGEAMLGQVQEVGQLLREKGQGIPLLLTVDVTKPFIDKLKKFNPIWCPSPGKVRFNTMYDPRKYIGDDRCWFYYSYGIELLFTPALDNRRLFWYARQFRLDGLIAWGGSIWRPNQAPGWTDGPVVNKSMAELMWRDSLNWPDHGGVFWQGWFRDGDSHLVYPAGWNEEPYASIRLANLRDGIQDWEYFYVLETYFKKLRAKNPRSPLIGQAQEALGQINTLVAAGETHSAREVGEILGQVRKNLARTIVAIKKELPGD
jgi:hypothetical protein